MTAFILAFIFWVNNYHYFIYALIITSILFFVRKTSKIGWKEKGSELLMIFGFIYCLLLMIISLSPFLKFKEFQWTHPDWKEAKAQVSSYESEWGKPFRKSSGYAYSNIQYQYKVSERFYSNLEKEVEKLYYPIWESKERIQLLKAERQQRTKEQIEAQKFILLYNTKAPKESKFFISKSLFYPQGSGIYAFSIIIGILILLVVIGMIASQGKKNKV